VAVAISFLLSVPNGEGELTARILYIGVISFHRTYEKEQAKRSGRERERERERKREKERGIKAGERETENA